MATDEAYIKLAERAGHADSKLLLELFHRPGAQLLEGGDHAVLINLMREVQSGMIEDGTALGDGLAHLPPARQRRLEVVLFCQADASVERGAHLSKLIDEAIAADEHQHKD